jgi:hypothetical protein
MIPARRRRLRPSARPSRARSGRALNDVRERALGSRLPAQWPRLDGLIPEPAARHPIGMNCNVATATSTFAFVVDAVGRCHQRRLFWRSPDSDEARPMRRHDLVRVKPVAARKRADVRNVRMCRTEYEKNEVSPSARTPWMQGHCYRLVIGGALSDRFSTWTGAAAQ